jgi:hypothetical protein
VIAGVPRTAASGVAPAPVAPSLPTATREVGIAGGAWLRAAGAASYRAPAPGLLAMGIGLGLFAPSSATMALAAIDPARTGLPGGVPFLSGPTAW